MLDIWIDSLTQSIRNRSTGEVLKTAFFRATEMELKSLAGWKFNWQVEAKKGQVFKMTAHPDPDSVQGLICLELKKGFVLVNLVENAPFNLGKDGRFEGVGGNLFAFACKTSIDAGFDGFVSFYAKTNLIEHYQKALGATKMGNQLMVIEAIAARKLVHCYF